MSTLNQTLGRINNLLLKDFLVFWGSREGDIFDGRQIFEKRVKFELPASVKPLVQEAVAALRANLP